MSHITLTNGGQVRLDPADAAWASRWRWHQHGGYARRTGSIQGKRQTVYLHRELAGAGPGQQVDHFNGDRLDCRRANLRVVSPSVNEYNKPATRRSTTGLRGVYERAGRYRAYVGNECLGTYSTPQEAHAVVLAALQQRAQGDAVPRAAFGR